MGFVDNVFYQEKLADWKTFEGVCGLCIFLSLGGRFGFIERLKSFETWNCLIETTTKVRAAAGLLCSCFYYPTLMDELG